MGILEGKEGGIEEGGSPGHGNWERRPAWAKTKDVDRQRVLQAFYCGTVTVVGLAFRANWAVGTPSVLRSVRASQAPRPYLAPGPF